MTSDAVRELAGKAAAVIRSRGWGQGSMAVPDDREPVGKDAYNPDWYDTCRVCALGAVMVADGRHLTDRVEHLSTAGVFLVDEMTATLDVAAWVATWAGGLWWERLTDWNDKPGRTVNEVLERLDRIAFGPAGKVSA